MGVCPARQCAGLGMANINPSILAATGRVGFQATGKAMSIVKAMGYLGLLIGPAVLGFLAKSAGLEASMLLVSSVFAAIAVLSFLSRNDVCGGNSTEERNLIAYTE